MGKYQPYSNMICPRIRWQIVDRWKKGWSPKQIAIHYDVHTTTVNKYIRRYLDTGSILSAYEAVKKQLGKVPRRKLLDDPKVTQYLLELCRLHPDLSLLQYQQELYHEFALYVGRETLRRFFNGHEYKFKKISKMAFEADIDEERAYWRLIETIVTSQDQMVFLDESYRSDITANKRRARGKGTVYMKMKYTKGGYKLTLILAGWIGGVLCHEIVFGSVNEAIYNRFCISTLLANLNAYPGARSVLIIDNCTFHHNALFLDLFCEAGVIVIHLPRYTPWYNLAEWIFRDLKMFERKQQRYGMMNGLLSLECSIEAIKNKNYSGLLSHIGYN